MKKLLLVEMIFVWYVFVVELGGKVVCFIVVVDWVVVFFVFIVVVVGWLG